MNFDQILRIKMAELPPLPVNNAQMVISSNSEISFLADDEKGPYEQFILFGDSITQMSCTQDLGFAWTPALQNGQPRLPAINWAFALEYRFH